MAYQGIIDSNSKLKQDFKNQRLLYNYRMPQNRDLLPASYKTAAESLLIPSFQGLKNRFRSLLDALSLEIREPHQFRNTFNKQLQKPSQDMLAASQLKPANSLLVLLATTVLLSSFILAVIAGFKWIF